MKYVLAVLRAVRGHPVAATAFAVVALLLLGTTLAIPLVRNEETAHFAKAAARSSELLVAALGSPANLTGEPESALSELGERAEEISRVHDEVVLTKVYFAKNAAQAALEYTDYTARIGIKLVQVARSEQRARTSFENYSRSVEVLKASSLATRAQAAEEANSMTSEARAATELAYQECVLLATLTRELPAVRSRSQKALPTLGQDPQPAIAALSPRLQAALEAAHARRKIFNPGVHGPG